MTNYVLIFDTETTGFPSKKVSAADPKQNVVVELGAYLYDEDKDQIVQQMAVIIQTLAPEISSYLVDNVHGISNEFSISVGVEVDDALAVFVSMCKAASWRLVGHNIKFDVDMMNIMFARSERFSHCVHDLAQAELFCTMNKSTDVCMIPPTASMIKAGRVGFKNPNLAEAFFHLTGESMGDAHRVHYDCMATLAVYKALRKGGY